MNEQTPPPEAPRKAELPDDGAAMSLQRAREVLEKLDDVPRPVECMAAELLEAAATCRDEDPQAYEIAYQKVRESATNSNTWQRAVRECAKRLEQDRVERRARTELANEERAVVFAGADLHRVVDEIDEAIASADVDVFARAGQLVRVVPDGHGRVIADPVPREAIADLVSRHICIVERKAPDAPTKRVEPPGRACTAYHARGRWKVPPLRGVVHGPVIAADGTIITTPGYHRAGELYLAGEVPAIDVPEAPTEEDARQAYELLAGPDGPWCDFQFADGTAPSAPAALALELVARRTIDGPTPIHLATAATPGAGKGLCQDVAAVIATGRALPRPGGLDTPDRIARAVDAAVMSGAPTLVLDNMRGSLGGSSLEALATARVHPVQPFYTQKVVEVPVCLTLVATMNGATATRDASRRVLLTELEVSTARPEARDGWQYPDLLRHVLARRATYLSAALTILRAWFIATDERRDAVLDGLDAWGSYEAYTRVVRGALVHAEGPDPYRPTNDLDPETAALTVLVDAWPLDKEEPQKYRAGTLATMIRDEQDNSDFTLALRELVRKPSPTGVGMALRKYRRRVVELDGGQLAYVVDVDDRDGAKWTRKFVESASVGAEPAEPSFQGSAQGSAAPTPHDKRSIRHSAEPAEPSQIPLRARNHPPPSKGVGGYEYREGSAQGSAGSADRTEPRITSGREAAEPCAEPAEPSPVFVCPKCNWTAGKPGECLDCDSRMQPQPPQDQ